MSVKVNLYQIQKKSPKFAKFSPKRSFSSYIKSLKFLKPPPPLTLTDSEKPTTAEEKAAKSQQQQQPEEEKQDQTTTSSWTARIQPSGFEEAAQYQVRL